MLAVPHGLCCVALLTQNIRSETVEMDLAIIQGIKKTTEFHFRD